MDVSLLPAEQNFPVLTIAELEEMDRKTLVKEELRRRIYADLLQIELPHEAA